MKPPDLVQAAKELQFEGIIAKCKGSPYEPGKRSGAWLKYQLQKTQELVVGGYTAGNPFDALIVGRQTKVRWKGQSRFRIAPALR